MRKILALGVVVAVGVALLLLWRGAADTAGTPTSSLRAGSADEAARAGTCRARIQGSVVDGLGRPVQAARVETSTLRVLSDANGHFVLDGVAAGTHLLHASAEGLVVAGPPDSQGARVTLTREGDRVGCVEGLRLTLHRPGTLRGRVVAGDTAVAAQLGLEVLDAWGLAGPVSAHALDGVGGSAADGRFEPVGVAPGRLRVIAESDQYAAALSREIPLRDGEVIEGLVIDLQPAATLRGVVRDRDGQAVAGASAVASGGGLPHALRATADSAGRFVLEQLPVGSVQVRVSAAGFRGAAREVAIAAAGVDVEFVLERASGLFGQVLDPEAKAPALAWVALRFEGGGRWLRTDRDGRFAWADPPTAQAEGTAISPFFAESSAQSLVSGEESVLQLGAGGRIQGVVVDASGQPVTRSEVGVERFVVDGPAPYNSSVFEVQRVSRSDGGFEVGPLRPGRYTLVARAEDLAPGRSPEVLVEAGNVTTGVVIRLGGGAVVRGQVRDSEGQPIAGARVSLFEFSSPFKPQETRTDASGHYLLGGLAEGRRSLRVGAAGFLTQMVSGLDVPARGELVRDVVLGPARKGADFAFHGIGAVLRTRGDAVELMQVIPGHGAENFGLKPGDRILAVDREPVDGLALDQVVERIRGEEGVAVRLDVDRPGEGLMTVDVERGEVVVERDPHHPVR
ncbi:MAG: carboxypeptidase regulatory-like domain-containing protein [Pseudomonadota bacterium]